jgi:hypothetical protein
MANVRMVWIVPFACIALLLGMSACDDDDGAAEKAGRSVDESMEAMRDAIDEGIEDAEEA